MVFRSEDIADRPGVYLMKNRAGKIIYVGKAKSLRKRLRSYFTGVKDVKTRTLMRDVVDIETIITNNEYEALLLENTLIKQWSPRYNINLKDGKSYPVIRITNEKFPRVFRTRRIIFDGSSYFGPFPQVAQLDHYLALIEKLFPLRKCRGPLKKREHPCLYYHMGRCSAPCCGAVSEEDYGRQVDGIRKLLSGRTEELLRSLKSQMEAASREREFERAAVIRDRLGIIRDFSEDQKMIDDAGEARDYLGMAAEENRCSFVVLQTRGGSLAGRKLFATEIYGEEEEALHQFILQYYGQSQNPPTAIYLPMEMETANLSAYLTELLGGKLAFRVPQRGRHRRLVHLASENARADMLVQSRELRLLEHLALLQTALKMSRLPRRIEGFDIAHLSGQDTVASMVSFADGKPDKSSYRVFKLRTLDGRIDDYEAMREIIARRYSRVLNEGLERPDLILVDGGKGQVSAARGILESLGLEGIPLAGLAKENEEVFLPGAREPVSLAEDSPALRMLQRVRDESHRFATGFHKRLRRKRMDRTMLEEIPGIGAKRSRTLLHLFGSLERIMISSPEELKKKAGLPMSSAEALIRVLKETEPEGPSGDADSSDPTDTIDQP